MNISKQVNISEDSSQKVTWYEKYKVTNWIHDKITDLIWQVYTRPLRRIKTIIEYMPLLWKDYHFDDAYLFDLMIFKITKMADRFESANLFVGVEYTVSRMRTVVKLLQKVRDEEYAMEYFDFVKSEFEFIELEEKDKKGDSLYEMKNNITEDNSIEFFKKYPRKLERMFNDEEYNKFYPYLKEKRSRKYNTEEERLKSLSMDLSNYNHFRAKKLVFKMMERYIESWWD